MLKTKSYLPAIKYLISSEVISYAIFLHLSIELSINVIAKLPKIKQ